MTIVEFTDLQCPFCGKTESTLKELRAKYGDKIRLVHMDYPLPFHAHALDAAKAAHAPTSRASSGSIAMRCLPIRASLRPPI